MFEIIGLFIGTAILFLLAAVCGAVYAIIAWLILPRRNFLRLPLLAACFALPIVSAAYMWLCVAVLPGESLFGDIDQPLPNGYRLTALGKMPEYGSISDSPARGSPAWTESLAVNGPLVALKICRSCDPESALSTKPYELLDTKNKQCTPFQDYDTLQNAFGRPVHLMENASFESQEPSYKLHKAVDRFVMFTPPIAALLLSFVYLLRRRRRESKPASGHLY